MSEPDAGLLDYYRRRAGEYEAIYARPERRADLEALRSLIGGRLEGARPVAGAAGEEFLAALHARLEPGSRVLLLDNRYVEGISTPVAGIDAAGNTYQMRRLGDGGRVRVLKNFVSETELRERLSPHAASFDFTALQYYGLAEYTTS